MENKAKSQKPSAATSVGERTPMPSLFTLVIGAAIGGAVMYMLDPVAGSNRRSSALSKVKSFGSMTSGRASEQLSGIRDLFWSLFSSVSSQIKTTADSLDKDDATAQGARTSFARKATATDPDAYPETH